MPKVGGKRKKTKTHDDNNVKEFTSDVPLSLILKRGKVGPHLKQLVSELRTTMYPYTAINLKESKANKIKDFLSLVDIYGLSHMIMLTNTDKSSYLRLAKMPKGPTITFRVKDYTLASDIFDHNQKNSKVNPKPLTKSFDHAPLVIMNGFNSENIPSHYKDSIDIASTMIQSFFPPINLNEIEIKKCKRVVLFNLNLVENSEGDVIPQIEFRHYDIDIEKYSMKKTISNLINNKKTDLSKFQNIADYVLKQSGFTSAEGSDAEDPNMGVCEQLDGSKGEKNQSQNVKVKLYEMGPRLNLELHKIEEGFLKGNVTFHAFMHKSKKEIQELMKSLKEKRKEKRERRKVQTDNIQKKKDDMTPEQKEKEAKKQEKQDKMLSKKRYLEKEKIKKEKDHKIMTKRSLKQFKNLKKGK